MPKSTFNIGGKSYLWLDGDTFTDTAGDKYRIEGYDAKEVAQITNDGDEVSFKQGEVGGKGEAQAIANIRDRGNFNQIHDTGNVDNEGRKIVRLGSEDGDDLTNTLYRSGIAKVNEYTSEDGIRAVEEGRLREALTGDPDKYADELANIPSQPLAYKTKALDERFYNPDYHNGVQFRNKDRNLDGTAKGFWQETGVALDHGLDGIKEGFYGYLDGIGQVTGAEGLQQFGEGKVKAIQHQMADQPKIVLDWKDIDGPWDGFKYVVNNAVSSSPYIG